MDVRAVFGLSVLLSFAAFGLVTRLYIVPWLRTLSRREALIALVMPHAFRFLGLSFIVPGVVSPSLPPAFAVPAAFGDAGAAILAMAAVVALARGASGAIGLVWVFSVWGSVDLLNAFYQGLAAEALGLFGAAFYIPTAVVPLLFVTHGLIFWLLLRPASITEGRRDGRPSATPLRPV